MLLRGVTTIGIVRLGIALLGITLRAKHADHAGKREKKNGRLPDPDAECGKTSCCIHGSASEQLPGVNPGTNRAVASHALTTFNPSF